MSPQDPKHVPTRCCKPHARQHDLVIYLMTASHRAHTRSQGRRDAAAKPFLPLLQFTREGRHGTTQAQGSQGTWSPCPHRHEPAAAPSSSVPPCPSCLEGLHILLACFLVQLNKKPLCSSTDLPVPIVKLLPSPSTSSQLRTRTRALFGVLLPTAAMEQSWEQGPTPPSESRSTKPATTPFWGKELIRAPSQS